MVAWFLIINLDCTSAVLMPYCPLLSRPRAIVMAVWPFYGGLRSRAVAALRPRRPLVGVCSGILCCSIDAGHS